MKKIIFLLSLFLVLSITNAQTVSLETAQKAAIGFIAEQTKVNNLGKVNLSLIKTYFDNINSDPLMYLFNLDSTGFLIVSAESKAFPILAFSFENKLDTNNIAPALKKWLKQYSAQLSILKSDSLSKYQEVWNYYLNTDLATLRSQKIKNQPPLLTTTWNQNQLYNDYCPDDVDGPNGKVYVGCVATAMGQILKYYNYPQQGNGSHSYYHWNYGPLSANFGNTTYNWNAMLNFISSKNDAIAELLYHCGVSVEMMYSPDGSGAYSEDVVYAAINFFRYSGNTNIKDRDSYPDNTWRNLLKNELDNLRPLYYSGYSNSGGHAFNCDGYNETPNGTFFHFNWGWGGYGNGYFFLDNMASPGGNFDYWQQAIFNMVPASNFPDNCSGNKILTEEAGTFEDGSSIYQYQNNIDCQWLIAPSINVNDIKLTFTRFDTEDNNDIIRVYDGDNTNAPLLGTFSGSALPPAITSTGNKMLIQFTTNNTIGKQGWKATYSTTKPIYCNNLSILADPSGTFNDGSMQHHYNTNTSCRWRIEPENASQITIGFADFSLYPNDGILQIFNVSSQPYSLLDEYTGLQIPTEKTYQASKILLWFKSGHKTQEGWSAYYSSITASTENLTEQNNIQIKPNPFTDILNINFSSITKHEVELYDISGKLVYQKTCEGNFESLNIGNLSNGIYLLRIINDNSISHHKIIKN